MTVFKKISFSITLTRKEVRLRVQSLVLVRPEDQEGRMMNYFDQKIMRLIRAMGLIKNTV